MKKDNKVGHATSHASKEAGEISTKNSNNLKTANPISEKDEVKAAEDNLRTTAKKSYRKRSRIL